ncbi:DsbA family protein [Mesorhizobium sp. B2-8-9]|uniref:DsbA family protein n=1 Tax=Mesorhizobium sp. B2-8-9 TaxID=2589899 RepID=UPI0011263E06|nr:DsbA family protein [Mesorhizobium sp. B2-8-9]TPI74599.1 DsbA family protein [Mesorhizobium sp. B2-8-9]
MADCAAASPGQTPVLEISYFTDPLCCWSWGLEPQLRRLRYGFRGKVALRLRMGGMIGGWDRFCDPVHDIHRPIQMGPLWIHASAVTGMPLEPVIWVKDPPASSWPACLAVKAAGLQSPAAGDLYLRQVRQALMLEARNVARDEVLVELACGLAKARPDQFDHARFVKEFAGRDAKAALQDDVREGRFRGVGRFPCLCLSRPHANPVWIVGWLPWQALLEQVRAYAPELGSERMPPSRQAYSSYWGGVVEREVEVAFGGSHEEALFNAQIASSSGSG